MASGRHQWNLRGRQSAVGLGLADDSTFSAVLQFRAEFSQYNTFCQVLSASAEQMSTRCVLNAAVAEEASSSTHVCVRVLEASYCN